MLQFSFAAHDFLYLYTNIPFSVNNPNFEITYKKLSILYEISQNKSALFYMWKQRKPSRRNSGRTILNQSKEMLCTCVSFQQTRDSRKEEPEANVYLHIFIILENTLK